MGGYVVLLGDFVFDNGAYVGPGPDVIGDLQQQLRGEWKASLLAVDGSVMTGVPRQLDRLPTGASMGGNDAQKTHTLINDVRRGRDTGVREDGWRKRRWIELPELLRSPMSAWSFARRNSPAIS